MYTGIVAGLSFEWDARKSAANKRKHAVSFEEARTVFYDENALLIADPEHYEDEDRFILLGSARSFECWWCATAIERMMR